MIRIIKQIDPETSFNLKKLAKKMVSLHLYKNPSFIRTDAQGNLSEWKKSDLISENVGPLTPPVFGLKEYPDGVFYTRLLQKRQEEVSFIIALTKNTWQKDNSDLSIFIASHGSKNKDFCYEPIKSGYAGDIFYLSSYFYNKRNIYENIYKSLLKNKNRLNNFLGEFFTEDLTELFSGNNKAESLKKYDIPKGGELDKISTYEKISYCYASREKYNKLGRSIIPLFINGNLWENLQVDLYLAPENKMLFDIDLEMREISEIVSYNNNVSSLSYFPYLDTIDSQINDWLNNLEQMTVFGYELLDKIKSKTLLENL